MGYLAQHQVPGHDGQICAPPGERRAQQSPTIDGVLVTRLELERRLSNYEPLDQLWLFRGGQSWTLMTLRRDEHWSDDGTQGPVGGTACATVDPPTLLDSLAETIRDRYGESGWRELLDAGHTDDAELFRRWAPMQIERDLERAVFFRPDLLGSDGRLDSGQIADLNRDVELHLCYAGFEVVSVGPPRRASQRGANLVMAQVIVRRYRHETLAIVRMDDAGEVYSRRADRSDATGPVLRELGDDDA